MKTYQWLRYVVLGIALLVLMTIPWLCWIYVTSGDHDSCHVIALELASRRERSIQGKVPQATVDDIATYLIRASVIRAKLTGAGPRASFDRPFHAVIDEGSITCYIDGWFHGWGAASVTVPINQNSLLQEYR